MKLSEALKIVQTADRSRPPLEVFLACGSMPLHLQTFLAAFIQLKRPENCGRVSCGIFGHLEGNISRIAESTADVGVVAVEWQDLDPRFGIRRASGWSWQQLPEIAADAKKKLAALERLIASAGDSKQVVVSFPTLPFPLLSPQNPASVSPLQAEMELAVAETKRRLVRQPSITILSFFGDAGQAFDATGELAFGFPYSLAHASRLAEELATALCPPAAKKGIITDLDMTLWNGIVGDDGIENVHWDLENHAQPYGLYQQLLHALAQEGVLVAAASKNSLETVRELFSRREDLIAKQEDFFPLLASWRAKSELVEEILARWNIGADSVVFIDDNAFELEEVGRKFPGMECIQFHPSARAVMELWRNLRMKFARSTVGEEDRIRSASIRARVDADVTAHEPENVEGFLAGLKATLKIDVSRDAGDRRSLELINKTNQFNLNGNRWSDAEFRQYLLQENSLLLTVSYSDKFGPLGKICSLLGKVENDEISVDVWVLSCRAFSRRIEFACLRALFDLYPVARIRLDWRKTQRNTCLQEFLPALSGGSLRDPLMIERDAFLRDCPTISHEIAMNAGEGIEMKI